MTTIYADNAATTAMSPAALAAMIEALRDNYANAASQHRMGQRAAAALLDARRRIAAALGADAGEVYFTSGGTEADNWALMSAARAGARDGKRHIVTSAFEHHAVLNTLAALEREGFDVTYLPVGSDGMVSEKALSSALRADTCLVSIMYANNELGTVQPVAELGALCRERGVLFHTDAVQAVGHIPVNVRRDNADMLSLSAHKFHGAKGIGALYCRHGTVLEPLMYGGAQERGMRPGTSNVPAAAAMAAALDECCADMEKNMRRVTALRDELIHEVTARIPGAHVNCGASPRLPGLASLRFDGVDNEALLMLLDLAGICCSAGAACSAGAIEPSHALLAVGLTRDEARGTLRISLGEYNTIDEVARIAAELEHSVGILRGGAEKGVSGT